MTLAGWEHSAWLVLTSLAESAVRTLALASIVALGLVVLRVRRAAIRLYAWTVVLYAALGLAVLGRMIPGVNVPVPAISLIPSQWLSSASEPHAVISRDPSLRSSTLVGSPADSRIVPNAPTSVVEQRPVWRTAMAAAYVLGAMWLLLRLAVGWLVARRLERSVEPVADPRLVARTARHAAANGLRHPPRLAQSDRLFVPMTTSALRPMIVLPDNWRRWSAVKLDAVLAHEMAHVSRRDALTQRLSLAYRAIFWISPLSWWLHHQLTELAELASDEAALGAGVDRTTYAETLVGFFTERPLRSGRADWHVAMARGGQSSAERRVEHVLAWDTTRSRAIGRFVTLGVILAVSPVLILAASVRPEPLLVQGLELPDLPAAPLADFSTRSLMQLADVIVPAPAIVTPRERPTPATSVGAPIVVAADDHDDTIADASPLELNSAAKALPVSFTPPAIQPAIPSAPAAPEEVPAPVHETRPTLLSSDIQDPTLVRRVDAKYTTEAMRAKVQGVVWLDVVVLPNGTVGDVKVVKSLDPSFGLDEKAIEAARAWLFKPGTRPDPTTNQRVPIVTVARLELEFRLH